MEEGLSLSAVRHCHNYCTIHTFSTHLLVVVGMTPVEECVVELIKNTMDRSVDILRLTLTTCGPQLVTELLQWTVLL